MSGVPFTGNVLTRGDFETLFKLQEENCSPLRPLPIPMELIPASEKKQQLAAVAKQRMETVPVNLLEEMKTNVATSIKDAPIIPCKLRWTISDFSNPKLDLVQLSKWLREGGYCLHIGTWVEHGKIWKDAVLFVDYYEDRGYTDERAIQLYDKFGKVYDQFY